VPEDNPAHVTTSGSGSKYFQIFVPDYNGQLDSYIRLGVPASTDASLGGGALWSKFKKFADQDFVESDGSVVHDRDRTGTSTRAPLLGEAATPAGFWSKLGWRDHCDGNRLSTTGGDKIEIVKGNYQLLVLGRNESPDDGAVLDMSGGHFWSEDVAPGTVTKTEYKSTKFDGTWKITEETTKGHVHEIFRGEFKEEFTGSKKTSIVGNVPSDLDSDISSKLTSDGTKTNVEGDPDVVDGTFADKILEYTKASELKSYQYVTTIEETIEGTSLTSNVYVQTIKENFGKSSDHVNMVTYNWGTKNDIIMGVETSTVLGLKTDFFLGKEVSAIVGTHEEFHLGLFREITIGYKWDLVIGAELEVETYSHKVDTLSKWDALSLFLG
jgi:hypothetical protein